MADLKEKLIARIQSTNDEDVLKEVYRLLELDLEEEVYVFSDKQNSEIEKAEAQIERGDYLSNEEANRQVDQWLKKK